MRRIKLFGMAVMALLALASLTSVPASAGSLPDLLPLGTLESPDTAKDTGGESTFGTGETGLESTESEGEESLNTSRLGPFRLTFRGVRDVIGRTCSGLSDSLGNITISGTFHVKDYKEFGTLLTAFVHLLNEIHYACGALLGIWRGCLASAVTPENRLTKVLTVTFARNGIMNDNLIITVLDEAGTAEEACQFLRSDDGGAFALTSYAGSQRVNFAIQVLVMRL